MIIYCHDTVQDMSPRAAWRLEAAAFTPACDFTAGKADWLAADLPFDGDARLVGRLTRRQVPAVPGDATVAAVHAQEEAIGFGPIPVLNRAGIVLGTVRHEQLEHARADAPVAGLLHFGVSTVRPSEQVADLIDRMGHTQVTRVVVTRSDGTLVGLFFAEDARGVGGTSRASRDRPPRVPVGARARARRAITQHDISRWVDVELRSVIASRTVKPWGNRDDLVALDAARNRPVDADVRSVGDRGGSDDPPRERRESLPYLWPR